jgi:hypothetical protein
VTFAGIITFVKFVQYSNAKGPMVMRALGNWRLVKAQNENAKLPIFVTVSGIVIDTRLLQLKKADPMLVILFGITTRGRLIQSKNIPSGRFVRLSEIETLVRATQKQHMYSPMLVTESGILSEVRFEQDINASAPILVI